MTAQPSHQSTNRLHVPVLLEAVLQHLAPRAGDSYLDVTAGYGGHATAVLAKTGCPDKTVLVDRDSFAVAELQKVFAHGRSPQQAIPDIRQADFLSASQDLLAEGQRFDMILADLGLSSPHLDEPTRGFAILADGPLDMRMDQTQHLTAAVIVNDYTVDDIADILKRYGEEPKARQIAKLLVQSRPVTTTGQLAAIAAKAWPGHSKSHPATRTFQALRIAVNDELRQVEKALPIWMSLLAPGGRLAVISFHSLEDRLVKQTFAESAGDWYDSQLRILTKKPVTAAQTELVTNPRARSAKLRAVLKQTK